MFLCTIKQITMNTSYFIIVILLAVNHCFYAQTPASDELDYSQWYLRSQGFKINESTGLTLGVYEFQGPELRILEIPLLMKFNLTDNLSLLGGGAFDFYQTRDGFSNDFDASATFGIQFEPNKNSYIQGLFNYQMHSSNNPFNYKFEAPSSFSLRTGFKF